MNENGIREVLQRDFAVLFLDGKNQHGYHAIPCYPTSIALEVLDLEGQSQYVYEDAHILGYSTGDMVWAEFAWIKPQIDNEGRVELDGYWEYKSINVNMTNLLFGDKNGRDN